MSQLLATFLRIKNAKNINKEDLLSEEKYIYQFEIDGKEKDFSIKNKSEDFFIQNHLIPTVKYYISVDGDTINDIEFYDKADIEGIVIDYTPGVKNIKNFIKILLAPLGKTLYVFGGGWNIQDDNESFITKSIGTFPFWEKFYRSNNENYSYKEDTYPKNGWNEYFYAGLDCTGYMGWAIYNLMNTKSGNEEGFVYPSTTFSKTIAKFNYGTWRKPISSDYKEIISSLNPGDIISIDGHVYAVVSTCTDGSAVIIHSTVSPSISGVKGGGVQLSAISANGDEDYSCKAYKMAKEYMEKNYSDWTKRYPVVIKPIAQYLDFSKEDTGIFSWFIE